MSQIVGYVHENMDRYMSVAVFEAWATQRATAAERDQWRPVTWADGQGNETVDLRQPRERQMLARVTDLLASRLGTNADEWKEVGEARELLDRPVRERRDDNVPASADERYLRRLLALRVAMPHTYYDDGEAQGQEHGIVIDFLREPIADIDAKLRALNVARFEVRRSRMPPGCETPDGCAVHGCRGDCLPPNAEVRRPQGRADSADH